MVACKEVLGKKGGECCGRVRKSFGERVLSSAQMRNGGGGRSENVLRIGQRHRGKLE